MPVFLLIAFMIIAGTLGIKKVLENKDRIIQDITDEAHRQGVDANLALAIAQEESSFSSIRAADFETTGSFGIFQLEPGTASDMAGRNIIPINDFVGRPGELLDIQLGVAYIKWLLNQFGGNQDLAIQAYNEGIGNIKKGRRDPVYLARVTKFYDEWGAV